jgi:hypothetical protein
MPKMVVTAVYTMTNNNEQRTMNCSKQTQTKPKTRSEAEIPTGELLGIHKPGTKQTQFYPPPADSNVTFQKWGITSEHS